MDALAIIIFMWISLWSITKTLEKLTDKIIEKQNRQIVLLEEIKSNFKGKSETGQDS